VSEASTEEDEAKTPNPESLRLYPARIAGSKDAKDGKRLVENRLKKMSEFTTIRIQWQMAG
jgi:hypothetical protein